MLRLEWMICCSWARDSEKDCSPGHMIEALEFAYEPSADNAPASANFKTLDRY